MVSLFTQLLEILVNFFESDYYLVVSTLLLLQYSERKMPAGNEMETEIKEASRKSNRRTSAEKIT